MDVSAALKTWFILTVSTFISAPIWARLVMTGVDEVVATAMVAPVVVVSIVILRLTL